MHAFTGLGPRQPILGWVVLNAQDETVQSNLTMLYMSTNGGGKTNECYSWDPVGSFTNCRIFHWNKKWNKKLSRWTKEPIIQQKGIPYYTRELPELVVNPFVVICCIPINLLKTNINI